MADSGDEIKKRLEAGARVTRDILGGELGNVSYGEALAHHGVKGMHWGVRKDDKGGGSSGGSSDGPAKKGYSGDYKAAHKEKKDPPPKEAAKNLAANEKKFAAKFDGDGEAKPGFLARNKKTLIKAGAWAGVIGGVYVAGKVWEAKNLESIREHKGQKISPETFAQHVNFSKIKTWGKNDYMKDSSFEREEFSLPAGHEFHRISTRPEDAFKGATYATHSTEDFHRYVSQFRQELGGGELHHVTFSANEEIRVPKLNTVLDSVKEALGATNPYQIRDEHALITYQGMSGGSWNDTKAEKMFDSLGRKGYHAIVDEMDAGVIGETPLVIFSPGSMGSKSSTALTNDDISHAESSLIDLENRKT